MDVLKTMSYDALTSIVGKRAAGYLCEFFSKNK
jgi:hypothetical protein